MRAISRRRFLKAAMGAAAALALPSCLTGCASQADLATTGAGGAADPEGSEGSFDAAATAVPGSDPEVGTAFLFDTIITLTVYGPRSVLDEALARCEYFEQTFSRTVEGSDVWRINHAEGATVTVQPETADIVARALDYAEQSDGLFDITIGAVTELWDFKEGVKPDEAALAEACTHVDYRGVAVDGSTVRLADPAARVDLGGIAKGYIADDLVWLFRDRGVTSACINLGGNVAVVGDKPDGMPWNVGIQDPNGGAEDVIASVRCSGGSVVTSGLYERQFTEDGVLYYHILDPRTGYPAQTDVVSSSLLTASSTDGDAYATTLFLMGEDRAFALLNGDDRLEGLLVLDDGRKVLSDGASFEVF